MLIALVLGGCGDSQSDGNAKKDRTALYKKIDRPDLVAHSRSRLVEKLHATVGPLGIISFEVKEGGCYLNVIAAGLEADLLQETTSGTVSSPNGDVAMKVIAEDGATTTECDAAVEAAMGWG